MKNNTKLKTVLISPSLDIEIKNYILKTKGIETFSHLVRVLLEEELDAKIKREVIK